MVLDERVAKELSAAAAAASRLASALGGAARAIDPGAGRRRTAPRSDSTAGSDQRAGHRRPKPKRSPVPLPPGIFEDSVEAAEFLVRVPGVLVLVDGYNVTKTSWPDLDLTAQRRHLLDALCDLNARTGAHVHVVFDGVDQAATPRTAPGCRDVQCEFTPGGVEADDVIIALAKQLPVSRALTVVSSDRRVQRGARSHGANLLEASQLCQLLNG